jgi:hypothetical protein
MISGNFIILLSNVLDIISHTICHVEIAPGKLAYVSRDTFRDKLGFVIL